MLTVLVETLLQDGAEIIPEFNVLLGRLAGLLAKLCQYSLSQLLADTRHRRVGLQRLAADVERQIFAVDDTAEEA